MALSKYISEFALNMQAERKALTRLSELDHLEQLDYFNEKYPCHLYMIVRRPKLTVDKASFSFDENKVYITFRAQMEDSYQTIPIELFHGGKYSNLRLETSYPYAAFKLFEGDYELYHTNAGNILTKLAMDGIDLGDFPANLDLEVLYIGQAYGNEGSRKAVDRLKNHATLQAIYEEANRHNPDKDILLCLFTFRQLLLTSFDGSKQVTEEELKLDDVHMENVMKKVLRDGITKQQEINFTEAALIKYFQPKYNTEYKTTFPSPAHLTYAECYDIDIHSICLEIDTEDLHCQLYSHAVERQWIHFAGFPLHSREDRVSIFNMLA